jgi:hypothetical protein
MIVVSFIIMDKYQWTASNVTYCAVKIDGGPPASYVIQRQQSPGARWELEVSNSAIAYEMLRLARLVQGERVS